MSDVLSATRAAAAAFREVYVNPDDTKLNSGRDLRKDVYRRNWELYTNEAFEELSQWSAYITKYGLYQYTRLVYNPFRRLVDWYAGRIYPGRLSLDGQPFPNGVKLAIPFSDEVTTEMRAAIAQLWQWSNFQTAKGLLVRYTAATGNCLGEVIDDTAKGRVRLEVIWPGLMDSEFLDLDEVGNVKQYALEYKVAGALRADKTREPDYTFRKEVTRSEIRFFKDERPFEYDFGSAVLPNNYGFAPAVWFKHTDLGGPFGASVFRGNFAKLDEINSLATHALDLIHKKMDPPIIMWSNGIPTPLLKSPTAQGELVEADFDIQRDIMMWQAAQGGNVEPVVGEVDLEWTIEELRDLIKEVENDHPELTMFQKLREMTNVTGPGARWMTGDTEAYFDEASGNYDTGCERWFQMGVAIAGMRVAEGLGGWQEKTAQRQKFATFNLESFERNELRTDITPRPLLALDERAEIELQGARIDLANKASGLMPVEHRLGLAGVEEKDRAAMAKKLADEEGLMEPDDTGRFGR